MTNRNGKSRKALMNKISALSFSVHETVLFLDTHPNCAEAMKFFNNQRCALDAAVREYEKMYGPLTANSTDTQYGWSWINSPWPWDNSNNVIC